MNRYFDNFQLIRYNNSLAINITERVALLNKVLETTMRSIHIR
jgi:hypothetical protein